MSIGPRLGTGAHRHAAAAEDCCARASEPGTSPSSSTRPGTPRSPGRPSAARPRCASDTGRPLDARGAPTTPAIGPSGRRPPPAAGPSSARSAGPRKSRSRDSQPRPSGPTSDTDRTRNEEAIRVAMGRLLRGELPPGGRCDLKSAEVGATHTGFYPKKDRDGSNREGPYQHLGDEFVRRPPGPPGGRGDFIPQRSPDRASEGPERRAEGPRRRPGRDHRGAAETPAVPTHRPARRGDAHVHAQPAVVPRAASTRQAGKRPSHQDHRHRFLQLMTGKGSLHKVSSERRGSRALASRTSTSSQRLTRQKGCPAGSVRTRALASFRRLSSDERGACPVPTGAGARRRPAAPSRTAAR